MKRNLILAAAFMAVAALGLWLWARNGLAVWVDAAIAFCS